MHFVIMGCGRVGSALAHELDGMGHTVSVIDLDDKAFRKLGISRRAALSQALLEQASEPDPVIGDFTEA